MTATPKPRLKIFRWRAVGPLLVLAVTVAVLWWLFADTIARRETQRVGMQILGAKVEIQDLHLDLKNGDVRIRGLTIASPHEARIRTFERGVEAETLACGTGTVAAAASLVARGEAGFPLRFRSRGGPELTVRGSLEGARATAVWLGGQGRFVFRGVWEGG